MAIFFVAVGLHVPLASMASLWWVVLLASLACVAIKALVNGGILWAGGVTAPIAAATGLALAQAGEFSLVLLDVANDSKAITPDAGAAATGIVAITLMLTPALMSAGRALGPRLAGVPTRRLLPLPGIRTTADEQPAPHAEPGAEAAGPPAHVIVAGYGPVGRAVAQRLELLGDRVVIIELNPATVRKQEHLGRHVVYGDAGNPEVLESAGVHEADAFISTIPDDEATQRAILAVRHESKSIFIAARASFLSKGLQARQLGADHVTIEEIATAEAMAEQVHREFVKRKAETARGAQHPTNEVPSQSPSVPDP
jgi:CPA2 family monovalent cation:H+ antiporter-2